MAYSTEDCGVPGSERRQGIDRSRFQGNAATRRNAGIRHCGGYHCNGASIIDPTRAGYGFTSPGNEPIYKRFEMYSAASSRVCSKRCQKPLVRVTPYSSQFSAKRLRMIVKHSKRELA